MVPDDERRPQCGIIEFCDGFADGGGLSAKFWFQAPSLKGCELRVNRVQSRLLPDLLGLVDPLHCGFATGQEHYAFTDGKTTVWTKVPELRNPLTLADLQANQPNTRARVRVVAMQHKIDKRLKLGKGIHSRNTVLRVRASTTKDHV